MTLNLWSSYLHLPTIWDYRFGWTTPSLGSAGLDPRVSYMLGKYSTSWDTPSRIFNKSKQKYLGGGNKVFQWCWGASISLWLAPQDVVYTHGCLYIPSARFFLTETYLASEKTLHPGRTIIDTLYEEGMKPETSGFPWWPWLPCRSA